MIASGLCSSAKLGFLTGVHQPGDVYRVALYTQAANIGPFTEEYTPDGEVRGSGYQAGGLVLTGYQAGLDGIVACVTWSNPAIWKNAEISAHGMMVYNASRGNQALCVVAFDKPVTSTNGNFKVDFPPLSSTKALIWIG